MRWCKEKKYVLLILAGFSLAIEGLTLGRAPEAQAMPHHSHDDRMEAQAGWKALVDAFVIPSEPGFFLDLPHGTAGARRAAIWAQGQGILAALDLAELSGNYATANQMLATIDAYRYGDAYTPYPHERRQASGKPPKRWYDDDGHVGLDLMQAFAQTGERAYLDKARSLFNFIKTGQHPEGGMLWCDESNPASTAMSSTGSDTEYALRLYIATQDQEYLRFAKRITGTCKSTSW